MGIKSYLCTASSRPQTVSAQSGEVQEWLNWPAWKASKRQKRFRGSNPLLSAKKKQKIRVNI